ncbi:CL17A protein, partial [Aegotheles bennettii]|nr:CL17A protein [Aegotheles bennettii]
IYSVAGTMTPVGDFRPASPDSFEDDYDDVSLSESDRGRKQPAAEEDQQSQKSKGATGHTHLSPSRGNPEPRGGRSRSRRVTPVTVLSILVALSFVAWALLFALAVVKHTEILEELRLLRLNYSEHRADVRQELLVTQQEQGRMRSGMHKYYEELQDITVLICRSIPDTKKCSAGWVLHDKSCYSFSTETMNWLDAKEICADQGAHLVIVDSEKEQVRQQVKNN